MIKNHGDFVVPCFQANPFCILIEQLYSVGFFVLYAGNHLKPWVLTILAWRDSCKSSRKPILKCKNVMERLWMNTSMPYLIFASSHSMKPNPSANSKDMERVYLRKGIPGIPQPPKQTMKWLTVYFRRTQFRNAWPNMFRRIPVSPLSIWPDSHCSLESVLSWCKQMLSSKGLWSFQAFPPKKMNQFEETDQALPSCHSIFLLFLEVLKHWQTPQLHSIAALHHRPN